MYYRILFTIQVVYIILLHRSTAGQQYNTNTARTAQNCKKMGLLALKFLDKKLNIFSQPAHTPKGRQCCKLPISNAAGVCISA